MLPQIHWIDDLHSHIMTHNDSDSTTWAGKFESGRGSLRMGGEV